MTDHAATHKALALANEFRKAAAVPTWTAAFGMPVLSALAAAIPGILLGATAGSMGIFAASATLCALTSALKTVNSRLKASFTEKAARLDPATTAELEPIAKKVALITSFRDNWNELPQLAKESPLMTAGIAGICILLPHFAAVGLPAAASFMAGMEANEVRVAAERTATRLTKTVNPRPL